MSATFLVEFTFELSGRGLVIAGQILDGTIYIGSHVALYDEFGNKQMVCITGVEMGDGRNEDGSNYSFIGLLVGELKNSQVSRIRNQIKNGDSLTVQDPIQN